MDNLDYPIRKVLQEQQEQGGIKVHDLPADTVLVVQTKHSTYRLCVLGNGRAIVTGGKYFSAPTEVSFLGSSWGTSLLKIGWIGYGMRMELGIGDKFIITSPVQEASLIGPDWECSMEWKTAE